MEFSRLIWLILACAFVLGALACTGFAWKYGALTAIELFSRKFKKRSTHNGGQEEA